MAFTKLDKIKLKNSGVSGLPTQPTISPQSLKEAFDSPAKEVIAPYLDELVDELESENSAMSIGASVPNGLPLGTQSNVQSVLSALTVEVKKKEDTPENVDVLNSLSDVDGELFYGEQKMAKSSELPTKISDLTNDSGFIEDADYVHTDNNFSDVDKTSLLNKVDKEEGKGLSTNDYSNADKETVTNLPTSLSQKVDKVVGKGLSSNDYTSAEKTKLGGIEEGANKYILPIASITTLGGVKADGRTTEVAADGTISVIGGGGGGAPIDDTTTATDKVWSSEKTNTEITSVSDKVDSIYEDGFARNNLYKPFSYNRTNAGITFNYNEDGSITAVGTSNSTAYSISTSMVTDVFADKMVFLKANHRYVFSGRGENAYLQIVKVVNGSTSVIGSTQDAPVKITLSEDTVAYIRMAVASGLTATLETDTVYPMLEEGSVATAWTTPNMDSNVVLTDKVNDIDASLKMLGYTLPNELKGMNYIDSNGVFHQKVSRAEIGTEVESGYSSSNAWYYIRVNGFLDGAKVVADNNEIANLYLVGYSANSRNNITNLQIAMNTTPNILIKDSRYTTDEQFKSALNGKYIYYELATEITKMADGNEINVELTEELAEQVEKNLDILYASGVTPNRASAFRKGNTIFLNLYLNATLVSDWNTLCTLPTEAKPNVAKDGICGLSTSPYVAQLMVDTAGQVRCKPFTGSGATLIFISFVYKTN